MPDDNKLKALADRLRGRNGEQAVTQAREAGKELAAQGVKMQDVSRVTGPAPRRQTQSAGDQAVRHRQILDKQQNGLVNPGRGAAPTPQAEPAKAAAEKTPAKEVAAVARDKTVAEAAKSFREAGVTGGKSANDVGRAVPAPTPALAQQQPRGRGR